MKISGGNGTNLVRHSSLPAGFMANINVEEEYAAIRGGSGGETPFSSANSLERSGSDDQTQRTFSELNSSENQVYSLSNCDALLFCHHNGETQNRPLLLAHHLSLPKSALEKLLQLQDSVPCKIRAEQGMATHPRSIAEKVRRTWIRERMRKLQDLVPYMDKVEFLSCFKFGYFLCYP
ncbi:hypothetical protein Ancab_000592 [Ancistrocladus abbreviatus]